MFDKVNIIIEDKHGTELQYGDKVEVTYYSYYEPLCSVIGYYYGDYIEVESGLIPVSDFWTKEIEKIVE